VLRSRLIPALLLDGQRLVKTNRFRQAKYVGDPLNVLRIFNEKEVDEVIILDINASTKGLEPNYRLLEELAAECFMPLTYGGGINSLKHAEKIIELGIEKICLKSGALRDLELVKTVSENFGAQAVVVAVDVVKRGNRYKLHQPKKTSRIWDDWLEFAQSAVSAGAGEILLTAVHMEGVMRGLDTKLIASASAVLSVPLVAHGGVGSMKDVEEGLYAGADAIAAGSFFVFHGPYRAVVITYPSSDDWGM